MLQFVSIIALAVVAFAVSYHFAIFLQSRKDFETKLGNESKDRVEGEKQTREFSNKLNDNITSTDTRLTKGLTDLDAQFKTLSENIVSKQGTFDNLDVKSKLTTTGVQFNDSSSIKPWGTSGFFGKVVSVVNPTTGRPQDTWFAADNLLSGKLFVDGGVTVTSDKTGPLLERKLNTATEDTYGIGHFDGNAVRVYASKDNPNAVVHLSLSSKGTYDDIVSINSEGKTWVKNDLRVAGSVCSQDTCFTPTIIQGGKDRLHTTGEQELYVLNKGGLVIGKEWGGNGNVKVQGDVNIDGKLCVNNTCLTQSQLDKIIASVKP